MSNAMHFANLTNTHFQ